jgi:hypothetical protein
VHDSRTVEISIIFILIMWKPAVVLKMQKLNQEFAKLTKGHNTVKIHTSYGSWIETSRYDLKDMSSVSSENLQ